jgi:choline-sulfatase
VDLEMNRRDFLQSLTAAAAVSALPRARGQGGGAARPNILLLVADQHRHDWVSANADLAGGLIATPNLDWMAAGGMRFTECTVAAPLCGPSRACLATGQHYDTCGVKDHAKIWPYEKTDSFYRRLRDEAGYHVLGTGKFDLAKINNQSLFPPGQNGKNLLTEWGFSDGVNNMGKWDGYSHGTPANDPWFRYLEDQGLRQTHLADYQSRFHNFNTTKNFEETHTTPLPDSAYNDNWLAEQARTLIAAAPADKPWFCQVNFSGPHEPSDITASMDSNRQGYPAPFANTDSIQNHNDIRRNYTAMIENIDRQLGLFLQALSASGELANTLILYTADHGEMLGDHNRWEKKCPYRPSVGVPLYARGPGVQAGVVSEALVNLIDLAATCMDVAGLEIPRNMQARSLRPVLEGQTAAHRDYVLSGMDGWRMVYDGRYKLVRGFDPSRNISDYRGSGTNMDAPLLLFDLETDPQELTNVAAANPAKVRELAAVLDRETLGMSVGAPSEYRP